MSIRLSEKFGVNPAIPRCFFCAADKNEIILPGRLPGDKEAPHGTVWNLEPCDRCAKHMAQGIIVVAIADGEAEKLKEDVAPNPYRTGGWWVVDANALETVLLSAGAQDELVKRIIKVRFVFLEDNICRAINLNVPETDEENKSESCQPT